LSTICAPAATLVAGVDEAGRGPLAGPVVAAAVILRHDRPISGLADSRRGAIRAKLSISSAAMRWHLPLHGQMPKKLIDLIFCKQRCWRCAVPFSASRVVRR
jgi:hypothetical protein